MWRKRLFENVSEILDVACSQEGVKSGDSNNSLDFIQNMMLDFMQKILYFLENQRFENIPGDLKFCSLMTPSSHRQK